jgi:hypothetical protein
MAIREGKEPPRKSFDRAVTARSNCSWAFVLNKTSIAGWGLWLRDAGRGPQKDRVIGTSGDRVIGKATAKAFTAKDAEVARIAVIGSSPSSRVIGNL